MYPLVCFPERFNENFYDLIREEFNLDEDDDPYELEQNFPIELELHCRSTYPCYIVALRKHIHSEWRGETKIITPDMLTVTPDTED